MPSVRTLFFDLRNERKPGYRAVANRKGDYAAMLVLSVFSVPSVRTLFFDLLNERKAGYRAVAKRKGAYAAMPALSVFSVPSVRALFLIFGMNENRGIAPSRIERALTPRCLFSPCPLCEPCFAFKICQLQNWRFQRKADWKSAPQREKGLTPL